MPRANMSKLLRLARHQRKSKYPSDDCQWAAVELPPVFGMGLARVVKASRVEYRRPPRSTLPEAVDGECRKRYVMSELAAGSCDYHALRHFDSYGPIR